MKNMILKKSNLQTRKVNVKNQNLQIKIPDQDLDQGQYMEVLVFKENYHKYHRIRINKILFKFNTKYIEKKEKS